MSVSFPVRASSSQGFRGKDRVTAWFAQLSAEYRAGSEPCLFLPSLAQLSAQLDCTMLDIQCTLNGLRKQGYDFFYLGPDSPITFWCPSKLSLITEN